MISKAQVQLIRSLEQKKYRKQHKLFVAEGVKLVNELLNSALKIHSLYAVDNWIVEKKKHLPAFLQNKINIVSEKELQSISSLTTPNQVLALVHNPQYGEPELTEPLVLLLDGIKDPGNMGTIIRTADWFGVSEIVCSEDCVDVFSHKVVQASMGSIARVKVMSADLAALISRYRYYTFYAATMDGSAYQYIKAAVPCGVVIGSEAAGIRPDVLGGVKHKISIKGRGQAESLNAAIACGIILSHFNGQD